MSDKNTKGTSTDLSGDGVEEITSNLRRLLADVFALYIKTKNFRRRPGSTRQAFFIRWNSPGQLPLGSRQS